MELYFNKKRRTRLGAPFGLSEHFHRIEDLELVDLALVGSLLLFAHQSGTDLIPHLVQFQLRCLVNLVEADQVEAELCLNGCGHCTDLKFFASLFEFGNHLTLAELSERTATLAGEEIALTAREFDLLYKLLSYPKKTFTRTQLMDEFWDVDTQSGTRTVDVYMTKLRSKLAACTSFEIQTVHGLGYKAVIK